MKARNTLLFIIIILVFLGGISALFPRKGIACGKRRLYFPTIEDILRGGSQSTLAIQHIQALEESVRQQQYQDSIYADSLSFYTSFFEKSPTRFSVPHNNWDYFNDIFVDMDSCLERNEIIRILHFGDSQIESDRITGYIRQQLQEKFGGKGPGLLPAIQPIPSYTLAQSATGGIGRNIITGTHQNRASHKRYGVMGQLGTLEEKGSISVIVRSGKTVYENVKEIHQIRLFVGRVKNFKVRLTSSGKETVKPTVTDDPHVKVYTWNLTSPVSRFTFNMSGSAEIYGFAADGVSGVAVDNIPFRGSSGTFFTSIDSTMMISMLNYLNVRLILLEFGGNMMPGIRGDKAIDSYREKMAEQISYLKTVCPEAKILLIGPSDMSTKVQGQLSTYPYLNPLVEAMEEVALQNGAAFWNVYEVMGGHNSMIEWVRHTPALAAPDHVHFTNRGAERIATLFYETLMVYYNYYRFITDSNNKEIH